MKINCDIIEDLIPLYLDDVCSDQSKKAVEDHIKECKRCKKLVESANIINIPKLIPEKQADDKAVKKAFKKIRFRWFASILTAIIVVSLIFLGWRQYTQREINNVINTGNSFMKCVNAGNYEKAYSYINIKGLKNRWAAEWFDKEKLENIESDALLKFCEYGKKLEEHGGINGYEYVGTSTISEYDDGTPVYNMIFKVNYENNKQLFEIAVSKNGIEYFHSGGSFITDPLAQFSIWSEYLWQDYEGCYFDPELKDYVYY